MHFVNKIFAEFQELFYNVKSKSGWILSNLKNRRVADKRNKNSNDTEKEDENANDDQVEDNSEEYTEQNAKDDCTFLRSVVVNSSNRAKIEEKLIATTEYRKKICMDTDNSLLKQFPCFFTHSDLVSCCYLIASIVVAIHTNIFCMKHESNRSRIRIVLTRTFCQLNRQCIYGDDDQNIVRFFFLENNMIYLIAGNTHCVFPTKTEPISFRVFSFARFFFFSLSM